MWSPPASNHSLGSRVPRNRAVAVIFDLDGTLIDSRAVMDAAFTLAYRRHVGGMNPPLDGFHSRLGDSFPNILATLGLPPAMAREFVTESRRRVAEIEVCEEAVALCRWLNLAGVRCGLLTGKDRERTLEILNRFRLRSLFGAIATSSDGFRPKPAPDGVALLCRELKTPPGLTVVVGDSPLDVIAGRAAGTRTIACLWGTGRREQFAGQGRPSFFANQPEDLTAALQGMVSADRQEGSHTRRQTSHGKCLEVTLEGGETMPHVSAGSTPMHDGLFGGCHVRTMCGDSSRDGKAAIHSDSLVLGEVILEPGASIPRHRHNVEEGFYVLSGRGTAVMGNQEIDVRRGDTLLSRAGDLHGFRNDSNENVRLLFAYPRTHVAVEYPGLDDALNARASQLF